MLTLYITRTGKPNGINSVRRHLHQSPSGRTQQTAELIGGNRPIHVLLDDNLKEIDMGMWEGKTLSAIKEMDSAAFHAFWNSPNDYVSNGGKSFSETLKRVREVLKQIEHKYPPGNMLIVTHSVVIKCLFTIFNNNGIENLWNPPFIEDTSLTIIEISDEGYQLILEGCTVHKNY